MNRYKHHAWKLVLAVLIGALLLLGNMLYAYYSDDDLPAGTNARVYNESTIDLYAGPGSDFEPQGTLAPGDPLQVIGQIPGGAWFEINTFDERSGWVQNELITLINVEVDTIPLSWADLPSTGGIILTADRLQNAHEIYLHGQQLGHRANTFIVVGDSTSAMSDHDWYALFYAVANGGFSLGPYTDLQTTIDFYMPSGKFGASFQSAQSGFATDFVLDPTWADPTICQPDESPLMCEIRVSQPAFAIIYIGIVDMANYNDATWCQEHLEIIVTTLIDSGVIPVLTTFSIDESHHINEPFLDTYQQQLAIIREMATRRHLPLIEFQQAALALPHQGCIEDGRHLYYNSGGSLNLADDNRLGQALRERMTLQMMDALRVYLFGG